MIVTFSAQAQILDDSTKEIYSHLTTRYRTENQLLSNSGYELTDSTLENFSQKADFLYQGDRWFQNLGVYGSAGRPLYFELPSTSGLRYGSNAFNYLITNHQDIRYYNTLSPFSSIQYVQGGRKRQMLRAYFSQNIRARWNITGYYQRLTALRTFNVTQSEQRLIDHHSLYVSSNYTSKNGRFKTWGYYQHSNHLAYETGGVLPGVNDTPDSLFSGDIEKARLNLDARNRELRNNWYATFKWNPLGNDLFIRTSHLRTKQINRFTDYIPELSFYGSNLYFQTKPPGENAQQADTLYNERIFRSWENTAYVGFEDSSYHLSGFIRSRASRYYSNIFNSLVTLNQWSFGARISGSIWKGLLEGEAEYFDRDQWQIHGQWHGYGLRLWAKWMSYMPSVMQREFVSKNLVYQTSFHSTKAFHMGASQILPVGKLSFIPGYEQYVVVDGIGVNSSFLPFQVTGTTLLQYVSLQINGKFGKTFFTENKFIRVFQSGAQISQMPGMTYHSAHWVELVRRKRGYGVQMGINLDWRADWQSENYQPLTGQWFLQNEFGIRPYFLCDFFTHIRIQRARIYLKVHNVNQGLGTAGYFAAPYYPGQKRLFELGLIWNFYD